MTLGFFQCADQDVAGPDLRALAFGILGEQIGQLFTQDE